VTALDASEVLEANKSMRDESHPGVGVAVVCDVIARAKAQLAHGYQGFATRTLSIF